jgi:hypothetical protein
MSIDLAVWEFALRNDVRLNARSRQVAHALADGFRKNGGRCQLSFEAVATAAQITNLSTTRQALSELRLTGWVIAGRVASTGPLEYRPVMSTTAPARQGTTGCARPTTMRSMR